MDTQSLDAMNRMLMGMMRDLILEGSISPHTSMESGKVFQRLALWKIIRDDIEEHLPQAAYVSFGLKPDTDSVSIVDLQFMDENKNALNVSDEKLKQFEDASSHWYPELLFAYNVRSWHCNEPDGDSI